MVEAARTTASTTDIWIICAVSVTALAFFISSVMIADMTQARASRRKTRGALGLTPGEALTGGPRPAGDTPAPRSGQAAPSRSRPAMPPQRSGDADPAERNR